MLKSCKKIIEKIVESLYTPIWISIETYLSILVFGVNAFIVIAEQHNAFIAIMHILVCPVNGGTFGAIGGLWLANRGIDKHRRQTHFWIRFPTTRRTQNSLNGTLTHQPRHIWMGLRAFDVSPKWFRKETVRNCNGGAAMTCGAGADAWRWRCHQNMHGWWWTGLDWRGLACWHVLA